MLEELAGKGAGADRFLVSCKGRSDPPVENLEGLTKKDVGREETLIRKPQKMRRGDVGVSPLARFRALYVNEKRRKKKGWGKKNAPGY